MAKTTAPGVVRTGGAGTARAVVGVLVDEGGVGRRRRRTQDEVELGDLGISSAVVLPVDVRAARIGGRPGERVDRDGKGDLRAGRIHDAIADAGVDVAERVGAG